MESQLLPDLTKSPTRRPACYLTPRLATASRTRPPPLGQPKSSRVAGQLLAVRLMREWLYGSWP